MKVDKKKRYKVVIRFENGMKKIIKNDFYGSPLNYETYMEELQNWYNEKLFDTSIVDVRAYDGRIRIA